MRVMIVSGSLSRNSGTRAALRIAAEVLRVQGVDVDFYDLAENRFPLYDPDADSVPEMVVDFRQRAMAADGFLFGTPEYHSGMSGTLKNAFDYIGSKYVKEKPVGLLACAGGGKGGMNALTNLRTVARGILALVLPEQVVVDEDDFEGGILVNEARRGRIESLARSLARFVKLLALEKQMQGATSDKVW